MFSFYKIASKVMFISLLTFHIGANANLIRNPSFEDVPGSSTGQGLMVSEWVNVNSSADTYSNDGSYGLSPSGFGNFTGKTAQDGIRWVAGWSGANEAFGQLLSTNLTAGTGYSFEGYLLQAVRRDLNNEGGYRLLFSEDAGVGASDFVAAEFGPTTNTGDWEFFSVNFTAPANAADLDYLILDPFGVSNASAYPGIDAVSLTSTVTAVPEPSTNAMLLMGAGLLALNVRKRKNPLAKA